MIFMKYMLHACLQLKIDIRDIALKFFMSILMIRIKFILIPIHRRNAILIIIREVPLLFRITFAAWNQPQLERLSKKKY